MQWYVAVIRRCPAVLAALLGALLLSLPACETTKSGTALALDSQTMLSREPLTTQPWDFHGSPGTQITTEHYRIFTTIRSEIYQRLIARVLEAAHARCREVNPGSSVPGPLNAYIFGSRSQWELYTRLNAGANHATYLQISAGGYCQEGVFAGYDIGREGTLSVISHEAWHQYGWFAFKDKLPSFLEEGLAAQNEAIEWDGYQPALVPERNYRRFLALKNAWRDNRLFTLAELSGTHAGRIVGQDQKAVDAYYAQLWALALFLEHSKYRPKLLDMLHGAQTGSLRAALPATVSTQDIVHYTEHWNEVAGPTYLIRYISADPAGFEREYREFIRNLIANWPPKLPKVR